MGRRGRRLPDDRAQEAAARGFGDVGEQGRQVGPEGRVRLGEGAPHVAAQGLQAVALQQGVHRLGMPAQGGGQHHPEGQFGQGRGPAAEAVQRRPERAQRPVRAPIGVGDGHIGDLGHAGAGGQRQAEVAHHHLGPGGFHQGDVVVEIGVQARAAEQRPPAAQPFSEGLGRLGPQRQDLDALRRPGVVALWQRQEDLAAVLGQAGGQRQRPGGMGEGRAFPDEQNAQAVAAGFGLPGSRGG